MYMNNVYISYRPWEKKFKRKISNTNIFNKYIFEKQIFGLKIPVKNAPVKIKNTPVKIKNVPVR